MSCVQRRKKGWARIAQVTGLPAGEMETIFQRAKEQAQGQRFPPAVREEITVKTRELFGYLAAKGIADLPTHARSGLPETPVRAGFAAVWDWLARQGKVAFKMSRRTIVEALRDLDRRVSPGCEVIIAGGAAMVLHFGGKHDTKDVDVLVRRGAYPELLRAAQEVAAERVLRDDWLNSAVEPYADDILPPDFADRLTLLDLGLRNMRVFAIGRPEEVALKAAASRSWDLTDLDQLYPQMSPGEWRILAAIARHTRRRQPLWADRIEAVLREHGWPTD